MPGGEYLTQETARCVHELFEEKAAKSPSTPCVVCEGQQLTYGELDARANQLAHYLRKRGVGPETIVALCAERSLALIVGVLGVLKAGGAYLPLDPSHPTERLCFMLRDSSAPILLTQAALTSNFASDGVTQILLDADWPEVAQERTSAPAKGAAPENLAYVLYTSGSTGMPKGVMVEHRNLAYYVHAIVAALSLDRPSSFMLLQPLSVDFSVTVLYGALLTGGLLHVMSYATSLDAKKLAAYASVHPIDVLKIAPPHLYALMRQSEYAKAILPRSTLIFGGDVSYWELVKDVRALSSSCRIFNHYGPTETTVGVTVYAVNGVELRSVGEKLPIGRPLSGTQVYVLDPRREPVREGAPGELYIGGASVSRGYLNRPELTSQRFIPNPFRNGDRLYRTGDTVRCLPDGNLEFLGRVDNQVKIRGHRIEPGEVEAAMMKHPEIGEAIVMAQENGLAGKRLIAFVVGKGLRAPAASELRAFLRRIVPAHMVPEVIVPLEALPRMAHGKIDRRGLLAMGSRLASDRIP